MRTLPSGRQIEYCIPYRFESKEERDAWIADGESGMRSANYREATRRRDISSAVDRARKIADSYDLSRQRVHQIVKKSNA